MICFERKNLSWFLIITYIVQDLKSIWICKVLIYRLIKIVHFQLPAAREASDHPLRVRGEVLNEKLAVVTEQVVLTRKMMNMSMQPSNLTRVEWRMVVPRKKENLNEEKEASQSSSWGPPPYTRNNNDK